jgi:hypothetical protein
MIQTLSIREHVIAAIAVFVIASLLFASASVGSAFAKPPGAQLFDVHDDTVNGLQAGDPDIGNVRAVGNPGGQSRLIIEVHMQKAAPNCTYNVELVRGVLGNNGGLSAAGHTGPIDILGTLTTNKVGNGNAHFDIDPQQLPDSIDGTPGVLDTVVYAHLDIEDANGTCIEADGTTVATNEYGAAPLPGLGTPLNWME